MISRAESGDMYRGLPGQKLKPSESAPHSSAVAASSEVRMPQIFTLTRCIIIHVSGQLSVVSCQAVTPVVHLGRASTTEDGRRTADDGQTDHGPLTTDGDHCQSSARTISLS